MHFYEGNLQNLIRSLDNSHVEGLDPKYKLFTESPGSVLMALCDGNPLVTIGFPSQKPSNVESISMLWSHDVIRESVRYGHSVLSEWLTGLVLYGWTYTAGKAVIV